MFQINFQTITGKLPTPMSKWSFSEYFANLSKLYKPNFQKLKSALFPVLYLVSVFTMASCGEDPGNVGSRFADSGDVIEQSTIKIDNFEFLNTTTFSGNLQFMALGKYDDPLFGMIETVAFVRPSIIRANIEFLTSTDNMTLQLHFSSEVLGDTTTTANFSVYEISGLWRGNELFYTDNLSFDTSNKLGEFSVSSQDSINIELDDEWVSRYDEFLTNEADNRDSIYRAEFPGLAIVSDDAAGSKILFARMRAATDLLGAPTGEPVTSFPVERPSTDEVLNQTTLDWGNTITRSAIDSGAIMNTNSFASFNTLEQLFAFEPDFSAENLEGRSLSRVELQIFENAGLVNQSLPQNHVRPDVQNLRIHLLSNDNNVAEQIFSNVSTFGATRDSTDNSFRFNITNFANSRIFGDSGEGKFYFSIEGVNGLLFSTLFFDTDALENRQPRINITAVGADN